MKLLSARGLDRRERKYDVALFRPTPFIYMGMSSRFLPACDISAASTGESHSPYLAVGAVLLRSREVTNFPA
jgi:hypothetical protein